MDLNKITSKYKFLESPAISSICTFAYRDRRPCAPFFLHGHQPSAKGKHITAVELSSMKWTDGQPKTSDKVKRIAKFRLLIRNQLFIHKTITAKLIVLSIITIIIIINENWRSYAGAMYPGWRWAPTNRRLALRSTLTRLGRLLFLASTNPSCSATVPARLHQRQKTILHLLHSHSFTKLPWMVWTVTTYVHKLETLTCFEATPIRGSDNGAGPAVHCDQFHAREVGP